MKRYYANLLGNWIDITDSGTVADHRNPSKYFEEMYRFKDGSKTPECFEYGYIHVQYDGKDYCIHPSCIQIVSE